MPITPRKFALQPSGRNVRLYLLDVLRLGAALSVMFYHFVASGSADWSPQSKTDLEPFSSVVAYGAIGVQFFFMVSGFVILMSLWGRSLASFTASRISRLFPAYWAAVLLCSFLFLIVAPGEFKDPSFTQVAVNLTMLQEGLGVKNLDGAYWTLWVELVFYITVALFAMRSLTANRVLFFAFMWPLVGAMALAAKQEFLTAILIPRYAPFFALGMVVYLVFSEGSTILRWLSIGFNLVLGGYMTVEHFLPTMERVTERDLSSKVVWALLVAGVLVLLVATVSPVSSWGFAWMSVAGALTYPLYLVHEYWGWWIIAGLGASIGPWATLAIAVGFVMMLAWLVYRFIEVPFGKRFRRAIERGLAEKRSTGACQASAAALATPRS
jgi:peptidoglycan/LPS O-acetylase OafA/YrhL